MAEREHMSDFNNVAPSAKANRPTHTKHPHSSTSHVLSLELGINDIWDGERDVEHTEDEI